MPLVSTYNYSINAKGRINFPSKFLAVLGNKFYLTIGLDGCLSAYSEENFDKLAELIDNGPEGDRIMLKRYLFGNACEAEADAQGRIIIPRRLREYAKLESKVVVLGVSNKVEIWAEEKWNEISALGDDTADKLKQLMIKNNI